MSEPDGEKLPSGWQQTDLGTVVSLSYGKGLPEETRQSGNFPVCGSNGRVGTHSRALIEGPAIIVGRKGTVGAVHFEPGPCWPIDTTYFVNQFPQLHPRFVCYQLIHLRLGQFDKSTAIPGISRTDVYAKSFVLCSLREQERIADALDELFSDLDVGVAALGRVREKLKLYRASVLKAAVEGTLTAGWRKQHPHVETASELLKRILAERRRHWEKDQLAKIKVTGQKLFENWKAKYKEPAAPDNVDLIHLPKSWALASMDTMTLRITSGSRDWQQYYGIGSGTFIMAQNVRPGRFDPSIRQPVSPPPNDPSCERSRVKESDLLVTIVGANTGDVCRVPQPLSEHYVCQSVALMRPVDRKTAKYLDYYHNAQNGGQMYYRRYIYGAGRPHLSFDQLKVTPVIIPHKRPLLKLSRTIFL